jgi:hypothetical protein
MPRNDITSDVGVAHDQARRTQSANTGNIRYGTRGMTYNPYRGEGSFREVAYPWARNFQNQARSWRMVSRRGSR